MNPCGSPAPCCCMGPNTPSLLRFGKGVVYAEIHDRSAAKRTSYGELPSRRHTLVHSIASQVGVSHRENDIYYSSGSLELQAVMCHTFMVLAYSAFL